MVAKVRCASKEHAGKKTFITLNHFAEMRMIAEADVAPVLPGTVEI